MDAIFGKQGNDALFFRLDDSRMLLNRSTPCLVSLIRGERLHGFNGGLSAFRHGRNIGERAS